MYNETIARLGYPDILIKEHEHWVILLRNKQVTAGSLVLACKEKAQSLAEVSAEAYAELPRVVRDLEAALKRSFGMDKINYLALMMVDKEVHFHVIPRYASPREFAGVTYSDTGWPRFPDLTKVVHLTEDQFAALRDFIRSHWP